jgi:hypothetical protein
MGKGRRPTKQPKQPTIAGLKRLVSNLIDQAGAFLDRANAAEHKLANPEFENVMDLARRWHHNEILAIVDGAIRDVNAPDRDRQDLDARAFLAGYLESEINPDRHMHCIVPAMAGMVLACSDSAGAYEEEFGSESVADIATCAAHAMRVDAWALLESRSDEWDRHHDEPQADH